MRTHLLALTFLAVVGTAQAEPVGVAGQRMDVLLPGPELAVKPLKTATDPLDLRILAVYPHGTAGFRYDLEFIGYIPGKLNLSPWLKPKDGAQAVELPPIEVEIASILPPGTPGPLEATTFRARGIGGGYSIVLLLLITAWFAAGIALLVAWIKSRRQAPAEQKAAEPTAADQLRPWIQRALKGELDATGKAELERKVMGFWRQRMALTELPPGEALQKIRDDREAGQLLRLVEDWLHNPNAKISEAEVNRALEPYATAS